MRQSESNTVGTEATRSVFVYGTLMPGESRWDTLAPCVEFATEGVVEGYEIFTTDHLSYPFAHVSESGVARGYFCVLSGDWAASAIRTLDRIEGYDPVNPGNSLFVREEVVVRTARGSESTAWMYRAGPALLGIVESCRPVGDVLWSRRSA